MEDLKKGASVQKSQLRRWPYNYVCMGGVSTLKRAPPQAATAAGGCWRGGRWSKNVFFRVRQLHLVQKSDIATIAKGPKITTKKHDFWYKPDHPAPTGPRHARKPAIEGDSEHTSIQNRASRLLSGQRKKNNAALETLR